MATHAVEKESCQLITKFRKGSPRNVDFHYGMLRFPWGEIL